MTWLILLGLIPLDVLAAGPSADPTSGAVYPQRSHGFAAYVVGGFIGLGILVLAMILLSLRPRRAQPRDLGQ